MSAYNAVDTFLDHHQQPKDPWILDTCARLERRLELGRTLPDSVKAWLERQPERLAFWHELLTVADVDGIADARQLQAWQYFGTKRRQRYLLSNLESYGVITQLDHGKVKVTA